MDDYLGSFEENARVRRARRQRELASATQQDGGSTTPPAQPGVGIDARPTQQQPDSEFKMSPGTMQGISNLFTAESTTLAPEFYTAGNFGTFAGAGEAGGSAVAGEGASSGLGAAGSAGIIAAIVAAISGIESTFDDTNHGRHVNSKGEFVDENDPDAVRTSDAFSMHFFTDPMMTSLLGNEEEPTAGEKADAAIANGDWDKALAHGGSAAYHWADPGASILGMAADKYLGDGWSWVFNPVGNLLEEAGMDVFG